MCKKLKENWHFSKFSPIISTFLKLQLPFPIPSKGMTTTSLSRSQGWATQMISSSLLTTSEDWSLHLPSLSISDEKTVLTPLQDLDIVPLFSRYHSLLSSFNYPFSNISNHCLINPFLLSSNMQRPVSNEKINCLTSIF